MAEKDSNTIAACMGPLKRGIPKQGPTQTVMAGLVPGVCVYSLATNQGVDTCPDAGPDDSEFSMPDPQVPFWRRKALSEMTRVEWESLCDGCGRCCLNKLIDDETNETVFTDVSCRLLDCKSCRCSDYAHRQSKVKDCIRLTPRNVRRLKWLPPTCAYRLVAEGKDLAWWHPLVSGNPESVHTAGVSVRGRVAASEADVPDDKLEEYIVSWPGKWPKWARAKRRPHRLRDHRPRGEIAKS